MEGIKDFFTAFWQRKVLRIIAIIIILFIGLYFVMLLLADREIYGIVISQWDGSFEIAVTEKTYLFPDSEPWLNNAFSCLYPGSVIKLSPGNYPPWDRGKLHIGNTVKLRTVYQILPDTEGVLPLRYVLSVKVLVPFEDSQEKSFPGASLTQYARGTEFAALIQKFNGKEYAAPYTWGVAGKLEQQANAPWYYLIYTGPKTPKNGRPFMTLFTVETKNGETKAAAEQYEYAEVDYKADNHADMVFSHDNQTEALRIPLW